MEKPFPLMLVGFTSGKSAEIPEEDGIRLRRMMDQETEATWFYVTDIYGADVSFKISSAVYTAIETEESSAKYDEYNPKEL